MIDAAIEALRDPRLKAGDGPERAVTDAGTVRLTLVEGGDGLRIPAGMNASAPALPELHASLRALLAPIVDCKPAVVRLEPHVQTQGGKWNDPHVQLRAASQAGVSAFTVKNVSILLEVRPKIRDADIWTMRALAGSDETARPDTVHVSHGDEDFFLTSLLRDYAAALRRMRKAGLRRGHVLRHEVLSARVRGRVHVSQWLRELTRGHPERVPCSYSDLSLDNLPNRTLRWAAHVLLRVGRLDPRAHTATKELRAAIRGLELDRIPLLSVSPSELDKLGFLPPSFDHYGRSRAIELASFVIRAFRAKLGTSLELKSFSALELMYQLFEDAFAGYVSGKTGQDLEQVKQVEWDIGVVAQSEGNKNGEEDRTETPARGGVRGREEQAEPRPRKAKLFKLDVFVRGTREKRPIVLDLKWKTALERGHHQDDERGQRLLDIAGSKIANVDLFQVLAYMRAYRARYGDNTNPVGVLVYPVAGASPEDPRSYRLEVAKEAGDAMAPLDLWLVPWDVVNCRGGIERTWETIEGISKT